jgi:heme oxygenase
VGAEGSRYLRGRNGKAAKRWQGYASLLLGAHVDGRKIKSIIHGEILKKRK